jgi:hypothetical protein
MDGSKWCVMQPRETPDPPAVVPFPDSICHGCAAPPRYVKTRTSVFILCPWLPNKYPPQPVRVCPMFKPRLLGPA